MKHFKQLFALMLLILLGIGHMWAANASYTITFGTGSGDGTEATTSTSCATIVSNGSSYLSGNLATATRVYYNGSSGLKLGASSSKAGTLKMNLSTSGQVTPTSIVVNAKRYNSSKAVTLKVNGSSTQSLASSFNDYTYNITSAITYIQIDCSQYCWISSITVNYTTSGGGSGKQDLSLDNSKTFN